MGNDDGVSSSARIFDKDVDDCYLFPTEASDHVVDFRNSGSPSSTVKRKTESLFCVMRKRYRSRHKSDHHDDDDMDQEGMIAFDCCCSGSDTEEVSECSEFDVISLEDEMELMGDLESSKSSLPICNFSWPNGAISEEVIDKEDGVSCKEDQVLSSSTSASQKEVSREDPEILSNFDGENEVRFGDVVNMSSSDELRLWYKDNYPIPICSVPPNDRSSVETPSLHHIVSCGNELRLWNKDEDDPIPISNVPPPDDVSNTLLETCSLLHRIVSFGNEYKDKIGLEISPIPLTKTLEGPSRPWSTCTSLAAGRVEDSSMDDQLCDAEIVQTPSALYQDEVDDEICISDVDAMIRKLNLLPDDSDSWLNREEWNMSQHPTHTLLELEHSTRTSMRRAIMSQTAIAVLHCRDSKYFIKKPEVIIGRSSHGVNVDIDLSKNSYGSKISRRQVLLKLEKYGSFSLKNLGKRHIYVNGEKLDTGQIVTLTLCSSIDIRRIVLMFKVNKEAVKRFLKNNRTNNKDDGKFEWRDE